MRTPAIALLTVAALMTVPASSSHTREMSICSSAKAGPDRAPDRPPGPGAVCRAYPTRFSQAAAVPEPGYHHLGATTDGTWSGVMGRLEVRDSQVRKDTYDFVATRFMAKADTPEGIAWLEVGWAETGWTGIGKQRLYTFDTNTDSWAFYDQYDIKDGDKVWLYLQTEQDGPKPAWQAWLWWGDAWHLLTSQELPLTGKAKIEQYVEVHTDKPFTVPKVSIDNVQLKDAPKGALRYWREDVPTMSGGAFGAYCLDWTTNYDTWKAGSCS